MVTVSQAKAGDKRNKPDQPAPPTSAKAKKAKTKTYHYHPPITATTIKTLKWGDARDLMLPFLSEFEKATIHKKPRAELSKLLSERLKSGDVTPQQFWAVVGLEKKEKKKTLSPTDPAVTKALLKHKMNNDARKNLTPPSKILSPEKSPVSGKPTRTSPYPRPMHRTGGPPAAPAPSPLLLSLPRPQYKYTLIVPPSIWPSTIYPPGIVIGEPIPPSPVTPPSITGTFYSSSIISLSPSNQMVNAGNAIEQMKYILTRLNMLLIKLNAKNSDIISMSAHVVDIHRNGKDILKVYGGYMAGEGTKDRRTMCAWTMFGVSGLIPAGCVVQLEVKIVVRRVLMKNLILDCPSAPGGVKL